MIKQIRSLRGKQIRMINKHELKINMRLGVNDCAMHAQSIKRVYKELYREYTKILNI